MITFCRYGVIIGVCLAAIAGVAGADAPQIPSKTGDDVAACQRVFDTLSDHQRRYPDNALVTADGRIHPISEATPVVQRAVSAVLTSKSAERNLIVFIHGRGAYPGKAFSQSLLCHLSRDYRAEVIMFHWPSWDGFTGFPQHQATAAADDLSRLLRAVGSFQQHHPQQARTIHWSLLTQSMGSLVLETYLRTGPHPRTDTGWFDSVVISAPASSAKGHCIWLENLTFSTDINVFVNRFDLLLRLAELSHPTTLGTPLGTISANAPRAANATYHDLSGTVGFKHRYYLNKDLDDAPETAAAFTHILRGKPLLAAGRSVRPAGQPQPVWD